jgi:hypothetical protein
VTSLLGLNLSASGKYARDKSDDQSTQSKFVRQHTAASLFNKLRVLLHDRTLVTEVESAGMLSQLIPGALVELAGTVGLGPVDRIVSAFQSILPFVEKPFASEPDGEESLRIFELMKQDLATSPVVDVLLQRSDMAALITANREYFSEDVNATLLGGTFTLIGKVSAVQPNVDSEMVTVNRGAMGLIAQASFGPALEQMKEHFRESGVTFDTPGVTISGPYIQVLPLAIFI